MEFLTWHYTSGLKEYIENWRYYFKYINHYFTPRLLLKTLFLPWKRLILVGSTPGLNIQKKIEVSSFNLISRGIGAIARLTLVVVGILLYVLAFFGGMFGLILWVLIPLVGLPAYNVYRNRPQDYISRLMKGVESSNKESLDAFLSSEAGIFITNHLGVGKKKTYKKRKRFQSRISKFQLHLP